MGRDLTSPNVISGNQYKNLDHSKARAHRISEARLLLRRLDRSVRESAAPASIQAFHAYRLSDLPIQYVRGVGPKKAEVTKRVQDLVSQRLSQYGILVKQFTINELRAPPAVIEAINQKNVMQQQALTSQNELQKNTFQAQGDSIKAMGHAKAILAEAEAQAKANELLSRSVTANLVQYEMAKKWDGKMPQVSGAAMPMLQLGKP